MSSFTYLVFQTESTICKKSEDEIKLARMRKNSEIVKIGLHKRDITFSFNVF